MSNCGPDARDGLSKYWVRLPGTRLYVGSWLGVLLPFLYLLGVMATNAIYLVEGWGREIPLRSANVVDGLVAGGVYLGLLFLHEAGHAVAVRVVGGRVLRFGVGGGGAHVRYTGLETRPAATALVAAVGPVVHIGLAVAVLLLAGGGEGVTGLAAVTAGAALGAGEGVVNLVPWRGRRRRSDGWVVLTNLCHALQPWFAAGRRTAAGR